jgi:hypothetical protein
MNACVIKLDNLCLYVDLPATEVRKLLGDVVARYEGFFTFSEPSYPEGQPELLYKVLADGYGLPPCAESVCVEVIDLRAMRVLPNAETDDQWKDPFASRILASAFASTINCS